MWTLVWGLRNKIDNDSALMTIDNNDFKSVCILY